MKTKGNGTASLLRHKCLRSGDDFQQNYVFDQSFNNNNKIIKNINKNNKKLNESLINEMNESYNDKNYLLSLIHSNDNRLRFEPQFGKSEVWNRFDRVLFNNIETVYVKCRFCKDIHKHNRFLGNFQFLIIYRLN